MRTGLDFQKKLYVPSQNFMVNQCLLINNLPLIQEVVSDNGHGILIKTFDSGVTRYTYNRITIGDLRPGRDLKYEGSIYNFALYSEILEQYAIDHNWRYTQWQLGIGEEE